MKDRITKPMACLALGAAILLGSPARADQWDQGADADNGAGTDNAPFHGSEQVHDLGALPGPAPDEDWYIARTHRFSSYEFVLDGLTGDLDLNSSFGVLQLVTATGTVLEDSIALEPFVRSLRFRRGDVLDAGSFVRVRFAACGTACTEADTYRARFYDTTYTVPRFNNSGTQTTVLLVQNNTPRACGVSIFFFDASGASLPVSTTTTQMVPYALHVVPLAGGAGQSGSVRVAHECGYGGLSGKAVSVEPATGFAFDTPMLARPR